MKPILSRTAGKTHVRPESKKLCVVIGIIFIINASLLGNSLDVDITKLENKWLVIVGNYHSFEEAQYNNEERNLDAVIVLSTFFKETHPGWFMLVKGIFDLEEEAHALSQQLAADNIDNYIKYTGQLFDFDNRGFRLQNVSEKRYRALIAHAFQFTGFTSPDSAVVAAFEPHPLDPTSILVINRNGEEIKNEEFAFDTEKIFWSSNSKKICCANTDFYAGSGDWGIIVIDLETMEAININFDDLTYDKDFGKREMFDACDLYWLSSNDAILFTLDIDFLGYSGHPGIDECRMEELGDDFNRNDPITLGNYVVYLRPD